TRSTLVHFNFYTPTIDAGGFLKMTRTSHSSSRRPRTPWTRERLVHERAIALGMSLERSSKSSYSSALQSYISFCTSHHFPVDPPVDTLSLYVVYMCAHIKPQSVESYLSGICHGLEPFYLHVRDSRRHRLVTQTLAGCKKLYAAPTQRKTPLQLSQLTE